MRFRDDTADVLPGKRVDEGEISLPNMVTQPAKIFQHPAAIPDGCVRVTIDIDAEIPEGIPDDLRRVLNENSQTLKFKDHGFEES